MLYHPLNLDAPSIYEKTGLRIEIRGNRLLYWNDTNQNVIQVDLFTDSTSHENTSKSNYQLHTKMQIVEHDLPIMRPCYIVHVFHKTCTD
jgi:hypothetical protein